MYRLTLIAQKGGTGWTTLAVNLSVAAQAGGPGGSGSAGQRRGSRRPQGRGPPAVAEVPATGQSSCRQPIDTAPHSESAAPRVARRRMLRWSRAGRSSHRGRAEPGSAEGPLPDEPAEAVAGRGARRPSPHTQY